MLGADIRDKVSRNEGVPGNLHQTRFGPSRLIEQGQDANPVQNHESKIKIGNEQ